MNKMEKLFFSLISERMISLLIGKCGPLQIKCTTSHPQINTLDFPSIIFVYYFFLPPKCTRNSWLNLIEKDAIKKQIRKKNIARTKYTFKLLLFYQIQRLGGSNTFYILGKLSCFCFKLKDLCLPN